MANRHLVVIAPVFLAAAVLLSACYVPVRHGILTFLFDGVPEPGALPEVGYASRAVTDRAEPATPYEQLAAVREVHAHPPYRNNRCGSCHDSRTGELFRTPREGLCQGCHTDIPGRAAYVHGPVAVSDCLFCHHHHTAAYPKVLLYDATTTCFRCHKRGDLTKGPHHEAIDQEVCVKCHNPHGGGNEFFLKRDEP